MKKTTLFLVFLVTITSVFGQKRVALQSNGTTTIYSGSQPYLDAFNDAVDGDTLYLPGGQLLGPTTINKSLTIYGAGLRSDTSFVTEKTQIPGFSLQTGADNFHIEGAQINGNITFANNNKIDSVLLKRVLVTGYISIAGSNQDCYGFRLQESIVQSQVICSNANSPEITNNIIRQIQNINNGYIANNVISYNGIIRTCVSITQSLLENNIINNEYNSGYLFTSSVNNSFNNNVLSYDPTADAQNAWNNNYVNLTPSDVLVNYIYLFDEAGNYNLIDPATYQGTTGNEIGLYGGFYPAKEGFMPENPHYQFKNIASQTNTSGELQIEITIEAQNE